MEKGLLVSDVISPEPVDGFKNLNGVWKLNRFCINCIELILKFSSQRVLFSVSIFH